MVLHRTDELKGCVNTCRSSEPLPSFIASLWDIDPGAMPRSFPAALLKAASGIYKAGLHIDQARALRRRSTAACRVISIGNLASGGTGKTPLTRWMCRFLVDEGLRPAVLSRGYGGKRGSTARVPARGDPCKQSRIHGDEPVLLARANPEVPVWVGSDRTRSAKAALSEEPKTNVLVLDDGFQHLALARDLDLVLLDCLRPVANGFMLPLGPLREPIGSLRRADALILTRADSPREAETARSFLHGLFPGKPVFSCRHTTTGFLRPPDEGALISAAELAGKRIAAFAGIAAPHRFFDALSKSGSTIAAALAFPDHHRYVTSHLGMILRRARGCGAQFLVTTRKDAVRLPYFFRNAVLAAEVEVDFGPEDEAFRGFLREWLDRGR